MSNRRNATTNNEPVAFTFAAMIARLDTNLAETAKRHIPAPKAGDNSFDPFADLASDIDVTQDETQAINAAARMFMQSAADKETGEQGKVRAFVYLAKVCAARSLDFSSKEKRADIGPKLWPMVKDNTRGVMFSHLAMFTAAAKLNVLDETVRSVYATHCQSPVAARQSLFNAVYSALSGRKKAAKDAKLTTTFAPLSQDMVAAAVIPPAKAPRTTTTPAEVTPLARIAAAAATLKSDVHNADDVAKILAALKAELEAFVPKAPAGPVTNAGDLSKPA